MLTADRVNEVLGLLTDARYALRHLRVWGGTPDVPAAIEAVLRVVAKLEAIWDAEGMEAFDPDAGVEGQAG